MSIFLPVFVIEYLLGICVLFNNIIVINAFGSVRTLCL